jgi:hypothetical protein
VSYDLINLVKKLEKVHKKSEHALDVVKGDPANFFGFHVFGIKESAATLQRGREGTPRAGLCFSWNKIELRCSGRWFY